MAQHLVLTVCLHEDGFGTARYHGMSQGASEWPPSPARVYQALVAGVARGNALPEQLVPALEWLEALEPPLIAAPHQTLGQSVSVFVPNNDADSLADPRDVSGIRTAKIVQPSLFAANQPILYAWPLTNDAAHARAIVDAANELYQLGRGIDMAWAVAEVLDDDALETRLAVHHGVVHRPEPGARSEHMLACPLPGSLTSLVQRHRAAKLRVERLGKRARVLFTNPPKPRFRAVSYNSSVTRLLFDLRNTFKPGSPLASWPLARSVELVLTLRGQVDAEGAPQSGAIKKLWDALPGQRDEISSVLIGRNATDTDKDRRVRILPLPSIGHVHVSQDIRRVMVEVPPNCPLRVDDIAWAFSGLEIASSVDEDTGELLSATRLVQATDRSMLEHYGLEPGESSGIWRSVTPLALPENAGRRRIEPVRLCAEAKNGSERLAEHQQAAGAVLYALRHADVRAPVASVQVQREPFEAKGSRGEFFSAGTRFAKERLWHVEITFATPVQGPLVLGDGRYAGLGLMRPVKRVIGIQALRIVGGLADGAMSTTISAALRRAVMARAHEVLGRRKALPGFFSGHELDGAPARGNGHRHLAFIADLARDRLLIVAPHVMEHRHATRDEKRYLSLLAASLVGLTELRAGAAGKLELTSSAVHANDPLLAPASRWESITEYRVTRHPKKVANHDALVADAMVELARRNLPRPTRIETINCVSGPHGGITGRMCIEFATAVSGPILIGQTCHRGGGLFAPVPESI